MDKWKTICSQALLDTKWVKVRKDAVELPNGQHIDDFYAITINVHTGCQTPGTNEYLT